MSSAALGGFDIAAMTGFFLGAAYKQIPVVIDGFISAVAALAAYRLSPASVEYMFASHHSAEPGFGIAMEALGLSAPLHLNMRLGEGSGCPLMFTVLDSAIAVLTRMANLCRSAHRSLKSWWIYANSIKQEDKMFRHVVCFRLRPEEKSKASEAREKLMSLTSIAEVRNIEVGLDSLNSPRSYDIILIVDFENEEDYRIYDAHELHQPVRRFMHSIVETSVAVDYWREQQG